MSSRARPTEPAGNGFRAFREELRAGWRRGAAPVVVRSVDSTNALARRALDAASTELLGAPRAFVAWGQTAGRGRRGRTWSSAPGGGVYASVLAPLTAPGSLELLPLLAPVVLCESLRAAGVAGCGLKWPNDLMVAGGKLGGVLIEAVSAAGGPRAAVVGFGVNYEAPSRRGLSGPAIGLAGLLRPPPSLAAVARRLLAPLVERLAALEDEAVGGLVAAYRTLSVHRAGDRLACRTATETLEGEFAGFDERGLLRLAVGPGERLLSAAEIVERA